MIRRHTASSRLLTVLPALSLLLASGCSSTDLLSSDKVDYRSSGSKTVTLDVPPDLSQLPSDARFGVPEGAPVTASQQSAASAPAASATTTVAPSQLGNARLVRSGDQRWIATTETPDQLWPRLVAFWVEGGFELVANDVQTGVLETGWAENRAKIPMDFIRRSIGRLFENAYDSGERDRFLLRVERTGQGSEIRITHRGMEEVYTSAAKDNTKWQPRASDSELEAIMLAKLLTKLGGDATSAKAAADAASAPERARLLDASGALTIQSADGIDMAWRRVTGALDRAGYVSHERDRRANQLLVSAAPDEGAASKPGFFGSLFGGAKKDAEVRRFRVQLKDDGGKSLVSIQGANGDPDTSDGAKALADLLLKALR